MSEENRKKERKKREKNESEKEEEKNLHLAVAERVLDAPAERPLPPPARREPSVRALRRPHPVVALVRVPEQLRLAEARPRTQDGDRPARVGGHVVEREHVAVPWPQVEDSVARGLEVVEDGDLDPWRLYV